MNYVEEFKRALEELEEFWAEEYEKDYGYLF